MKTKYGVLLAISSLPGRHGIGDFGKDAYHFVDWCKKEKLSYWQILPLNPLGPGNSPYMSICSQAIDTRYISLDLLIESGLLKRVPDYRKHTDKVDYYQTFLCKEKYLKIAYNNFLKTGSKDLTKFKKNNPWVIKYAVYLLLFNMSGYKIWNEWPLEHINYFDVHKDIPKEHEYECNYYIFTQMIAFKQWNNLWNYAKKNKISIIADCPFYVDINSVDCWLNKDLFLFDEKYNPTLVSGVPPDYFSEDGQLWGTPVYNFEKMKANNYGFLVNRLGTLSEMCDILRLDHFRAFDTYCVIPSEDINARRGEWWVGPRYDFFDELYKKYPNINLIAEDLGDLFQSVHDLRDHYNLPGMYIMQFCIMDDNFSNEHQIVYTGTHDNQTLKGRINGLTSEEIEKLKIKLNTKKVTAEKVLEYTMEVPSYMTIIPLQDFMGLDDKARMNTPGTVGSPNWEWKLKHISDLAKAKIP